MNLINAISNLKLRCSKVQIQIKLPWESSYIFYVWFWTVRLNRPQYEILWIMKKPFFSTHTSKKLMCKQDNSQSFTILYVEASRHSQFSYNWTTVVQNEQNYPSCSLVWSLGVLMKRFLSAVIGWLICCCCTCTVGPIVGNLPRYFSLFLIAISKRTMAFKGRPCTNV